MTGAPPDPGGWFAKADQDLEMARLGLADVRAFGLTWEDCEQVLRELGYGARVEIVGG